MATERQKYRHRPFKVSRDLITAGATSLGLVIISIAFGGAPDTHRAGDHRLPLRLAYFPNLTHAPALVGISRGEFQRQASHYRIEPKVVNAGPEAMEALLAGEVDIAYVGPSPAINTYLKSGGKSLEIIAGACSGGAELMGRGDENLHSVADLDGKRVAVPQLGGTQDVSLRRFLSLNGLAPQDRGGSVEIVPVKNSDMLALFLQKQIDAAWVPEPWASRLQVEAGAKVAVDERDLWPNHEFTTTVLVASTQFARAHPDAIQAILNAHSNSVHWLKEHPEEGKDAVNAALKALVGKGLAREVLTEAWKRVTFTVDPNRASILAMANAARQAGYITGKFDLSHAFLAKTVVASDLRRSR